jgi:hypothetical protein
MVKFIQLDISIILVEIMIMVNIIKLNKFHFLKKKKLK